MKRLSQKNNWTLKSKNFNKLKYLIINNLKMTNWHIFKKFIKISGEV
jgi:hypothetical protein